MAPLIATAVPPPAALQQYAKQQQYSLEVQNNAAELKLRAERKAGTMLADMGLQGGDRKSKSHDVTLKLADLGIGRMDSHRWQIESELSDAMFEASITTTREAGKGLAWGTDAAGAGRTETAGAGGRKAGAPQRGSERNTDVRMSIELFGSERCGVVFQISGHMCRKIKDLDTKNQLRTACGSSIVWGNASGPPTACTILTRYTGCWRQHPRLR
jgi:hypothetical protein